MVEGTIMRIIINEGRKVAVPTTRCESDALYYWKYDKPGFSVDCRDLHFGDY